MRNSLFVDTETTGLLDTQPHIIQLGFLLANPSREIASFHTLIDPEGQWEIPADMVRIHGITTEMCMAAGIPIRDALILFEQYAYMAGHLVAHNWEFDSAVIDLELKRLNMPGNYYNDVRQYCTMKMATDVCKFEFKSKSSKRPYRYPKLGEAYRFFTKREMEDAHTAYGDVRACRVVYEHLQNAGATDMWS